MIDMTQVQAAIASLGAVRDLVKVGIDAKADAKAAEKVIEAMGRLGQATDTLYALREELFRLQAENADLKRDAEEREVLKEQREKYELFKTAGGAVVYRFKGEPEHYACPNCLNAKRIEILQNNRTLSGKYRCTAAGCGAEYPIEPAKKISPQRRMASGGPGGWMGS